MTEDDTGHGASPNRSRPWSATGRGHCGARTRSGGTCAKQAGWGTPDHSRTGPCRLHGGATRNHRTAAALDAARETVAAYGLPVDVDPRDALLDEVHRTAGHVAWLGARVAALTPAQLVGDQADEDAAGAGLSPYVVLYQRERRHLREVCRDALAAGVAARHVQLAEQQGALLAGAVRSILADLDLSPAQWGRVADVVPRHLRAVSTPRDESA